MTSTSVDAIRSYLPAAAALIGALSLQTGLRAEARRFQLAGLWALVLGGAAAVLTLPQGPAFWSAGALGVLSAWPLWRWRGRGYLPDRALRFLILASLAVAALAAGAAR